MFFFGGTHFPWWGFSMEALLRAHVHFGNGQQLRLSITSQGMSDDLAVVDGTDAWKRWLEEVPEVI
jgi:hypothetical protein